MKQVIIELTADWMLTCSFQNQIAEHSWWSECVCPPLNPLNDGRSDPGGRSPDTTSSESN